HVDLAGDKGQDPRRHVPDDGIFDAVEIRMALLPVIRISDYLDRLVRFEFDEFEWTSADRMGAHVARRYMTGIDRREPGGQQCDKRGLRPLQAESDFVIAALCHLFEVAVPGLAR